jgi:hypothetical protein
MNKAPTSDLDSEQNMKIKYIVVMLIRNPCVDMHKLERQQENHSVVALHAAPASPLGPVSDKSTSRRLALARASPHARCSDLAAWPRACQVGQTARCARTGSSPPCPDASPVAPTA